MRQQERKGNEYNEFAMYELEVVKANIDELVYEMKRDYPNSMVTQILEPYYKEVLEVVTNQIKQLNDS